MWKLIFTYLLIVFMLRFISVYLEVYGAPKEHKKANYIVGMTALFCAVASIAVSILIAYIGIDVWWVYVLLLLLLILSAFLSVLNLMPSVKILDDRLIHESPLGKIMVFYDEIVKWKQDSNYYTIYTKTQKLKIGIVYDTDGILWENIKDKKKKSKRGKYRKMRKPADKN